MQNVGTPRFYINCYEYLEAVGGVLVHPDSAISSTGIPESHGYLRTNPTKEYIMVQNDVEDGYGDGIYYMDWVGITPAQLIGEKGFCALLGHNMASCGAIARLENGYPGYDVMDSLELVVNSGISNGDMVVKPEFDGWSLWTGDFHNFDNSGFTDPAEYNTMQVRWESGVWNEVDTNPYNGIDLKCNSVVIGNYHDIQAPDLKLKLSYEYDGVKNIQTKGGASLSNASYTKPADWGDMGAWQLGGASNLRNGRRVWDLSFSYLSDTDIMPVNATTSNPENTYPDDDTLLTGTDFFSRVWNRTMGGHLPFIFQPDKDNSNADQFAL